MNASDEETIAMFVQILGMDIESATILVENEITSLEEIAYVPFNELASIGGMVETPLQTWRQRARAHLVSSVIDDDDDGESQAVVVLKPIGPLTGGSSAPIEDNDKS